MGSRYYLKRVMTTMAVSTMVLLLPVVQADAATVETEATAEISTEQAGVPFSGRIGVGYLTGEARELVYWPHRGDHKASELTWDIDSLYMVGLGATVQARQWLSINIEPGSILGTEVAIWKIMIGRYLERIGQINPPMRIPMLPKGSFLM